MMAAETSRLDAYIVLCLLTGCRVEEARALRWDHVDLDGDPNADPPVPPHVAVWRSVRSHGDVKPRSLDARFVGPSDPWSLGQHNELAGGLVVLHVLVGRDNVVQAEDAVYVGPTGAGLDLVDDPLQHGRARAAFEVVTVEGREPGSGRNHRYRFEAGIAHPLSEPVMHTVPPRRTRCSESTIVLAPTRSRTESGPSGQTARTLAASDPPPSTKA